MWIQAKGKHCNINTKVEFKAKKITEDKYYFKLKPVVHKGNIKLWVFVPLKHH